MTGGRPGEDSHPDKPVNAPERASDHPAEAGAYIGHEPERAADTIPGGIGPDDERIAAHSTQAAGTGRRDDRDRTLAESADPLGQEGVGGEPG